MCSLLLALSSSSIHITEPPDIVADRPEPSAENLHLVANRPVVEVVLACARRLERLSTVGVREMPLRNRNLALLCSVETVEYTEALREAAVGLGACVAVLACDLTPGSPPKRIEEMARLLSRLYDAVTCNGVSDLVVDALARTATIPVTTGHIAAVAQAYAWAEQLGGPAPPEHKRRRILQALALQSMS